MSGDRVVISGASGLIGTALTESLRNDGVRVVHLVRRAAEGPDEVEWLMGNAPLDPSVLAGATAVVNLNGVSIGRLPWSRRYRTALRESRLAPTRTLATSVRELGVEAPLFVSASATGFYGDRPGETLTEGASAGSTFLARLCAAWEGAALSAGPQASVAVIRTASLLHQRSVLRPLVPLTKLGLGGPLGGGTQVWPWISLEDEVRAIRHVIDRRIVGPVNLVAPRPASANDIGRALARRLNRPFLLRVPRFALRFVLSRDAADSLLLADATVVPTVLTGTGFGFEHESVDAAIATALRPTGVAKGVTGEVEPLTR